MASVRNGSWFLFLLLASCVDPAADYDEYRARTETIRGKVAAGQGGQGGGSSKADCSSEKARDLPVAGGMLPDVSGTLMITCMANLSACDTQKALRFRADVKQMGNALELTFLALAPGARSVGQVQPDAMPFTVKATLNADGTTVSELFGDSTVPGPSNTATGHPLLLKGANFKGYQFDGALGCAELDGDVFAEVAGTPQPVSLNEPGDICLFERVSGATEVHDPPLSSFHCP